MKYFVVVYSCVFALSASHPAVQDDTLITEHKELENKVSSLAANLTALWTHIQDTVNGHLHTFHENDGHHDHHNDHDHHDQKNEAHVHLHMHIDNQECKTAEKKMSDEVHAHCEMMPNKFMPSTVTTKHHVMGKIHLVQKGEDELVSLDLHLTGFNMSGTALQDRHHGLHVHTYGDMVRCCESLGPHWNPDGSTSRDTCDLGNLHVEANGEVNAKIQHNSINLTGQNSIIGRSLVIYEAPDNGGSAGARIACCVIGLAEIHDHGAHDTDNHLKDGGHTHPHV